MFKEKRDIRAMSPKRSREAEAILAAKETGQSITYIDEDGCEVTAMPSGHIFYNAAEWW